MNRLFTKMAFLLALSLGGLQLHAQFTTTSAKNVNPGPQSGVYYSLPQTMLQLDFVIEETDYEEGPLSGYASIYFNMDEIVEYNTTDYQLLDVRMSKIASPDPNATFFVSISSGRGGSNAVFDILPNGIIRSVGSGNALVEAEETRIEVSEPQPAVCQQETPAQDFISLMTSGKTEAQLAREAVDKINEIRDARFKLVSGYYETAHNPETFNKMFEKLDEMEAQYTSLFLGKRVKKTVVKTIYVIPSKEVTTQTVAKFSETEGLTSGTSGMGSPIMVQTLPLNTTAAINAPSQSAVESMSYDNKLFYRVPEMANVKVSYKNNTLLEERLVVNQLGALLMAPIANTKMEFDTETGQIINFKMQ